jgi:hypothetical protein
MKKPGHEGPGLSVVERAAYQPQFLLSFLSSR